jgi:hypothetical protein
MHTQTRRDRRDAKRHINELHNLLTHISRLWLRAIAKREAAKYGFPQKVMLKAMAHYIRTH